MRRNYVALSLAALLALAPVFSIPVRAQVPSNPGVQVKGTVTPGDCLSIVDRYHIEDAGVVCGAAGPTGPAGGDLSGTYPNPTVAKINSVPVNPAGSITDDILFYNGTSYVHTALTTLVNTVCTAVPTVCTTVFGKTNAMWFGLDNTGAVDNGPACTAAYTSLGIHTGGTLVFPPGFYNFGTSCAIPSFSANGATGATPIVRTEMSGAIMFPSGNSIAIFDRFPVNQTEADNGVSARYEFIGGQFTGLDPVTGVQHSSQNTGIRLGASYTTYIEGTLFSFLRMGLDLQFALNAKVESIRCSRMDWYCAIAREGQWTGATTNNSQSNDTLFENVRDSANNAQLASFYIHATDGVIIRNSICEGGNPATCILFDDDRNTTVKSLKIDGLHVENSGSGTVNAIVTMLGSGGGVYTIQNVFNQTVGTLLDVSGFDSSGQTFNILDIDYTGGFVTPFKTQVTDANRWNFRGWFGNIRASTNWAGGHVPDNLHNLNGSTITANKLTLGDPAALNTPAWGIAVYGMANPVLDNMFDLGAAGILRWAGIYVGSNGLNSSDLAGSGTTCLNTDNTGKVTKASGGQCQTALGVQLLGRVTGVSIGTTGDTTLTLTLTGGATKYQIFRAMLQGKTGTFSAGDTVGIYTGTGQTGNNYCVQSNLGGITAVGDNVLGAAANLSCTGGVISTVTTLYVNVGASATSGTFDLYFFGVMIN